MHSWKIFNVLQASLQIVCDDRGLITRNSYIHVSESKSYEVTKVEVEPNILHHTCNVRSFL